MYSTCLFCNSSLGANEEIEHFPVGRRLAYDAAKGRLWVVCRKCERWNLTPLEERWEAIEECEREFARVRLRVSSDNVGLARLGDGLELVRIGKALRPEFAAWRYGDQFGRRRMRAMLTAGAGLGLIGAAVAGGMVAGVSILGFWQALYSLGRRAVLGSPWAVVAKIEVAHADFVMVRRQDVEHASAYMAPDPADWELHFTHKSGQRTVTGPRAQWAISVLLPQLNRFGASKRQVQDAIASIERAGGPEGYARTLTSYPKEWISFRRHDGKRKEGRRALTADQRITLEMALHEESERRAMEGELAVLEAAWRSAEEIAAIADDMFVPDEVKERIERGRRDSG